MSLANAKDFSKKEKKMAAATVVSKQFVECPVCGNAESPVDHLENGFESLWYCRNHECGARFRISKVCDTIHVDPTGEKNVPVLIWLARGDLVLLVRGDKLLSAGGVHENPNYEYFYNEHTCPENYLHETEVVLALQVDGSHDMDRHGLFKFVKATEWQDVHADHFDWTGFYEEHKQTLLEVLDGHFDH